MDALTAAATAVSHRHQSTNHDLFSTGVSARPALESRLMQYPSGPRPLPVNCGLPGPGQSPVGIDLRSIPASFSRSPPSSRGTESQASVPAAGPQCLPPSLPHGCTSPAALYDNRGQGFFANHHPGSGGGQNLNLRLPASPDSADVPVFYHPPPPPPPSAFLSNVVSAESATGLMDTAGGVSMATAMEAWRALTAVHQSAAVAAALAAGYGQCHESSISLPFGYQHYANSYGGIDVRRKNATRESTSTLKAWLYEHIKNPYPTKGEKIMLAIVTRMTLTQVSTWFANARRRLKKENKMQWSPRNRTGDDDDDDDDVIDDDDLLLEDNNYCNHGSNNNDSSTSSADCAKGVNSERDQADHDDRLSVEYVVRAAAAVAAVAAAGRNSGFEVEERFHSHIDRVDSGGQSADDDEDDVIVDVDNDDIDDTRPSVANQKRHAIDDDLAISSNPEVISKQREPSRPDVAKPRIWSLADVATSGTKTSDSEAITTQSPLFASLWSSFHQRRSPSLAMNNFQPWNAGISGCRIPAAAPPPLLPLQNPKEAGSLPTLNGFLRPVVSPPFPVRTASGVPDTERTVSPPLSCRSSLNSEDRCLKGFVGVSASDIIGLHRR